MAIRPGTHANNTSILTQFITFLVGHGQSFKMVNDEIVCAYIEYLLERIKSPNTVKNYISALNTMYVRMDICPSVFTHHNVRRALTGVDKSIRHRVSQAKTVTPELLKSIIFVTSGLQSGPTLRLLFLLMFYTMLRQSNFCPQSVRKFDPSRHLTRGDVSLDPRGLSIKIKWEKNLQASTAATEVLIPSTNDPYMCPVSAYSNMIIAVPTWSLDQPLICFPDGNPLTVKFLQKIWRRAVSRVGEDPKRMTLHGIRRGAATFVAAASPSARERLKDYGRWNSAAFRRYIANPASCPIYEALKTI